MEQTGLVLEGGGMRGIFTAGVLDWFLEAGISVDQCIGVSAGACHACSYLSGQIGRGYDSFTKYMKDKRYCSIESFFTTGNLFGVDFIFETIPRELLPIDAETFRNSRTKFQVVITNCLNGKPEYPEVKDAHEDVMYVRASSSLPLISKPVMINGVPYLDGGVGDSVPILQSEKQGNTKNIVVLTRDINYRKKKSSTMAILKAVYKEYPEFVEQMESRHIRYNETLKYLRRREREGKVLIIRPQKQLKIGRLERNEEKLYATYRHGYYVAKRLNKKIRKFLED